MMKKLGALIVALIFSITSTVNAAPFVYKLKVNEDHGRVVQRWKAPEAQKSENRIQKSEKNNLPSDISHLASEKRPTVVLIEDAHTSYDAQINIGKLVNEVLPQIPVDSQQSAVRNMHAHGNLRGLSEATSSDHPRRFNSGPFVGIEGAFQEYDLKELRDYPVREAKDIVSRDFVKDGKFIGAEYANIMASKPFTLMGVEDKELFRDDFKSFYTVHQKSPEIEDAFEELVGQIESLKEALYTKELKSFDAQAQMYETHALPFIEYISFLFDKIRECNIDLIEYVQLMQFYDAFQVRGQVNQDVLAREVERLEGELAPRTDDKNLRGLPEATSSDQPRRLDTLSKAHITSLATQALKAGIDMRSYYNINRMLRYWQKYALVDMAELLREVGKVNFAIRRNLAISEKEKALVNLDERVSRFGRLIQLEAVKEDVEEFRKHKEMYAYSQFVDDLAQISPEKQPRRLLTTDAVVMAEVMDTVEEFYGLSDKRDRAMVDNLVSEMKARNQNVGVLVAGGYHTPGITDYLKKNKIEYVTIRPAIEKIENTVAYMDRMMGGIAPLNSFFTSNIQISRISSPIVALAGMLGLQDTVDKALTQMRGQTVMNADGTLLSKEELIKLAKSIEDVTADEKVERTDTDLQDRTLLAEALRKLAAEYDNIIRRVNEHTKDMSIDNKQEVANQTWQDIQTMLGGEIGKFLTREMGTKFVDTFMEDTKARFYDMLGLTAPVETATREEGARDEGRETAAEDVQAERREGAGRTTATDELSERDVFEKKLRALLENVEDGERDADEVLQQYDDIQMLKSEDPDGFKALSENPIIAAFIKHKDNPEKIILEIIDNTDGLEFWKELHTKISTAQERGDKERGGAYQELPTGNVEQVDTTPEYTTPPVGEPITQAPVETFQAPEAFSPIDGTDIGISRYSNLSTAPVPFSDSITATEPLGQTLDAGQSTDQIVPTMENIGSSIEQSGKVIEQTPGVKNIIQMTENAKEIQRGGELIAEAGEITNPTAKSQKISDSLEAINRGIIGIETYLRASAEDNLRSLPVAASSDQLRRFQGATQPRRVGAFDAEAARAIVTQIRAIAEQVKTIQRIVNLIVKDLPPTEIVANGMTVTDLQENVNQTINSIEQSAKGIVQSVESIGQSAEIPSVDVTTKATPSVSLEDTTPTKGSPTATPLARVAPLSSVWGDYFAPLNRESRIESICTVIRTSEKYTNPPYRDIVLLDLFTELLGTSVPTTEDMQLFNDTTKAKMDEIVTQEPDTAIAIKKLLGFLNEETQHMKIPFSNTMDPAVYASAKSPVLNPSQVLTEGMTDTPISVQTFLLYTMLTIPHRNIFEDTLYIKESYYDKYIQLSPKIESFITTVQSQISERTPAARKNEYVAVCLRHIQEAIRDAYPPDLVVDFSTSINEQPINYPYDYFSRIEVQYMLDYAALLRSMDPEFFVGLYHTMHNLASPTSGKTKAEGAITSVCQIMRSGLQVQNKLYTALAQQYPQAGYETVIDDSETFDTAVWHFQELVPRLLFDSRVWNIFQSILESFITHNNDPVWGDAAYYRIRAQKASDLFNAVYAAYTGTEKRRVNRTTVQYYSTPYLARLVMSSASDDRQKTRAQELFAGIAQAVEKGLIEERKELSYDAPATEPTLGSDMVAGRTEKQEGVRQLHFDITKTQDVAAAIIDGAGQKGRRLSVTVDDRMYEIEAGKSVNEIQKIVNNLPSVNALLTKLQYGYGDVDVKTIKIVDSDKKREEEEKGIDKSTMVLTADSVMNFTPREGFNYASVSDLYFEAARDEGVSDADAFSALSSLNTNHDKLVLEMTGEVMMRSEKATDAIMEDETTKEAIVEFSNQIKEVTSDISIEDFLGRVSDDMMLDKERLASNKGLQNGVINDEALLYLFSSMMKKVVFTTIEERFIQVQSPQDAFEAALKDTFTLWSNLLDAFVSEPYGKVRERVETFIEGQLSFLQESEGDLKKEEGGNTWARVLALYEKLTKSFIEYSLLDAFREDEKTTDAEARRALKEAFEGRNGQKGYTEYLKEFKDLLEAPEIHVVDDFIYASDAGTIRKQLPQDVQLVPLSRFITMAESDAKGKLVEKPIFFIGKDKTSLNSLDPKVQESVSSRIDVSIYLGSDRYSVPFMMGVLHYNLVRLGMIKAFQEHTAMVDIMTILPGISYVSKHGAEALMKVMNRVRAQVFAVAA